MDPCLDTSDPIAITRVAQALIYLWNERPLCYEALFSPEAPRRRVLIEDAGSESIEACRHFGLVRSVENREDQVVGTCRIRATSGRFYLMDHKDYFQDLWPETDWLLDALADEEFAPTGVRVLDMGTGTGILAIEAAARGHRVVGTDLYETALELARFNGLLNSVEVNWRCGDLFAPVSGELFDRIVTVPHYGRRNDQLRVKTLQTVANHLDHEGEALVLTPLEWHEGEGIPLVETVLRPLAKEQGLQISLQPLTLSRKRTWFARVRCLEPGSLQEHLVSRQRFVIRLRRTRPGIGHVEVTLPEDAPEQVYVPLASARETKRPPTLPVLPVLGVLTNQDDLATLRELLLGLRLGELHLSGPLPLGIHELCRLGARPCVDTPSRGAAGAIVDRLGQVRPCSFGEPYGTLANSILDLQKTLETNAEAVAQRRGCPSCPALSICSRCLHPYPFSELEYCLFVREFSAELPALQRLLKIMPIFQVQEFMDVFTHPLKAHGASRDLDNPLLHRLLAALEKDAQKPLAERIWLVRTNKGATLCLPPKAGAPEGTLVPISEQAATLFALLVHSNPGEHEHDLQDHLRQAQIPSRLAQRALQSLAQALVG